MPPTLLGKELLKSICEHQELPLDSWYIIAATTLTILNLPEEVPEVYEYAINHGMIVQTSRLNDVEQLHVVRRMREALIKASAVGGVPKVRTHNVIISSYHIFIDIRIDYKFIIGFEKGHPSRFARPTFG